MINYRWNAPTAEEITVFLEQNGIANFIGPRYGNNMADVPSDPSRAYVDFQSPNEIELPEGWQVTEDSVSTNLLGVWA